MKYLLALIFLLLAGFNETHYSQNQVEQYKKEALTHISFGRFGEAIDQLNKFVAAKPHITDGYVLRALCFEKRGQYGEAVLDLRRAAGINPKDREIQQNLARVEKAWYPLLYKKIEGHKREIAIDPRVGENYLQIGKCMKDLGNWIEAENWYDEFLKREIASSDEIIRYSEILAKNNHIKKGEKALKPYTEKYPNDQRIWSRYGYFTLWLGWNRIAIKAFENALALKPFFKEAQDGLDAAKGHPYLFEWTDSTSRYKRGGAPKQQEYIIDKYYKMVNSKPDDDDTRFLLVNELMKVERVEEAYQQLQKLSVNHAGEDKFQAVFDSLISHRSALYNKKIEEYTGKVQKDPNNKDLVMKLVDYYTNLGDYENGLNVLATYLDARKEDEALDVRFRYTKLNAMNKEFDKARDQIASLLAKDPENTDYQLFKGQISAWTDQDMELGITYLKRVLEKRPECLDAIVSLGAIYLKRENVDSARFYLEMAKKVAPVHKDTKDLQTYFDLKTNAIEEMKIYKILFHARDIAVTGDYQAALALYDEYLSKITSPTRLVMAEYADINMAAKNFNKALEIYDQLLAQEYDSDIALAHAKTQLWGGDSAKALLELEKLNEATPNSFDIKLQLSDAYSKNRMYGKCEEVLYSLDTLATDSARAEIIRIRHTWIPRRNVMSFLSGFPNYIGLNPQYNYYWDNMGFEYKNTAGNIDFGINTFLTLGGSYSAGSLKGDLQNNKSIFKKFVTYKGHFLLMLTKMVSFNGGFGVIAYDGLSKRSVMDAGFRIESPKVFSLIGTYENNDAAILLSSPYLAALMDRPNGTRMIANKVKLTGYYSSNFGIKFAGAVYYIKISDGNAGNDILFRLEKQFYPDLFAGYEYNYINFAFAKSLKTNRDFYYYSPQNFESHSLFAEWSLDKTEFLDLYLGGKIGYVPASNFLIREISGDASFKPWKNLTFNAKLGAGGTFRDDMAYNYFSAYLSMYFSF